MNETVIAPPGAETDAGSVEKPDAGADTSIRALLQRAMAESVDAPPSDATTDETQPPEAPVDGAETPPAEDAPPAPPQSWTAAEREAWETIPRPAQEAIARREKAYQAGLRTDAELQKVLAPLQERLTGSGVHVDQYVQNLLHADRYIEQAPLDAALAILQRHGLVEQARARLGVAPESDAGGRGSSDAKIAELEARMMYQQQVSDARAEWDRFTAAHPDALELKAVIAAEIGANPRMTYAQAYERAREMVTTIGGTAAAARERQDIEAAAASAAKAGRLKLPRGRTDQAAKPASTGNLRDDIRAAARAQGIRL